MSTATATTFTVAALRDLLRAATPEELAEIRTVLGLALPEKSAPTGRAVMAARAAAAAALLPEAAPKPKAAAAAPAPVAAKAAPTTSDTATTAGEIKFIGGDLYILKGRNVYSFVEGTETAGDFVGRLSEDGESIDADADEE